MNLRRTVVFLMIVVLFFAYASALPIVLWGDLRLLLDPSLQLDYLVMVIGFVVALALAFLHVTRTLRQYTQGLHDLSPEDAETLTSGLVFGSASAAGGGAALKVQGGQVDLDGPPVVHKVGGPAQLLVDHNNVVVTGRLGMLARVLGPGSHDLRPFERVWDVVDLRPQRRTVTVEFMTRDGIPASCQASIVCRIASMQSEEYAGAMPPFGYSERAVLKVTTSKAVRKLEGNDRVLDWVTGMSRVTLTGAVRDVLERHRLDELLNPRYWLEDGGAPAPKLLPELETLVESRVRDAGAQRGIIVERVELGMVRPAEEAISRQWLEFWQARLQRNIDTYTLDAATDLEQLAEDARVEAQVRFLNHMLQEVQGLISAEVEAPPQLIVASFLDVLHAAMADQGPEQQRLLLQRAESILSAVLPPDRATPLPPDRITDVGN